MAEPEFPITDEAVSALDVSAQKEALTMLNEMRDGMGLTVLFTTHDLRGSVEGVPGTPARPHSRMRLDAQPGTCWIVPDIFRLPRAVS